MNGIGLVISGVCLLVIVIIPFSKFTYKKLLYNGIEWDWRSRWDLLLLLFSSLEIRISESQLM